MTRIATFFSLSLAAIGVCAGTARLASAEPPPLAAGDPAPPAAPAAALVLPEPPTPLIGPPTPGGLTADRVARRAVDTSHELRARAEESAAADFAVDQAAAGFIPKLTGQARYTRLSAIEQPSLGTLIGAPAGTRPGPLDADTPLAAVPLTFPVLQNQYSLTASLQIPLSDYLLKLPQLKAAAEHDARAAALLEQASQKKVAAEARIAYYGWARSRLQADVAERGIQQAEAHLKDAEAAFTTGSASKADVLRVQSQVATAQLTQARADSAVELYAEQLRVVMHESSGQRYEVGEDLRDPVEDGAPLDERTLIAAALEQRAEPQALRENADSTRARASTALASELPRLDAFGGATYANPNQRVFPQEDEFRGSWEAGLQVTWTPTDLFAVAANHSATLAKARQLDAEREQIRDGIVLEVKQELLAVKESETAMQTTERGLAAAEESLRVRRVMFQTGMATSVELTDAENEWSRAQLDLIGARIDRRIASVRLAYAVGR